MRNALIVGGANGIGLSIASELAARDDVEKVYIVDKAAVAEEFQNPKFESFQFDITSDDYSIFDRFQHIDTLIIFTSTSTPQLFRDVEEPAIVNSFNSNTISVLRILQRFHHRLESNTENFLCAVISSIAAFMPSPSHSIHAATNAAIQAFIESKNEQLATVGSINRILNVCLTPLDDKNVHTSLAHDIISHIEQKDELFIPQYKEFTQQLIKLTQVSDLHNVL